MIQFDDADERDVRRRQLAKRLLQHQARTNLIYRFAGYTRYRLTSLRNRLGVPEDVRSRGPSPTSFAALFRSSDKAEASCAAILSKLFGAVPSTRRQGATHLQSELELGELTCETLEAFQACFPWARMNFDQLVLITKGLAKSETIKLEYCSQCNAATLIDVLAKSSKLCSFCKGYRASSSRPG